MHTVVQCRVQDVNKDGQMRFTMSYQKYKAGCYVLKVVKEDCSDEYVAALLEEPIILHKKPSSHREAEEKAVRHLQSPPPLTSTVKKVPKQEAITMHKSRFAVRGCWHTQTLYSSQKETWF